MKAPKKSPMDSIPTWMPYAPAGTRWLGEVELVQAGDLLVRGQVTTVVTKDSPWIGEPAEQPGEIADGILHFARHRD